MSLESGLQVLEDVGTQAVDFCWDHHAAIMVSAWFVMVPAAVIAARYFKPLPTPYGIPRGTTRLDSRLIWWTVHYSALYSAIAISLVGGGTAMYVRGGFSGSVHAGFGVATIAIGLLQIVSAWMRGTHGGKHGVHSSPDDPSTWRGDHYDMTPRRRWFEAYHKTAGYFGAALACGAAASGLMRRWSPGAAAVIATVFFAAMAIAIVLEAKGRRQDTYRSVYGNHPDHPYNRARRDL